MVQGIEDLRTPLQEIIDLDKELRGTLSGFMMPAFVIDLPGGGGKRLVSTYETYDKMTGVATYKAPGLPNEKGKMTYTYYDPTPVKETELAEFRQYQENALERGETLEQFVATVPSRKAPEAPRRLPAWPLQRQPLPMEIPSYPLPEYASSSSSMSSSASH